MSLTPKSLTIFSHGIATITLSADVTANTVLHLPVPDRHINDVLKSLTVVDQGSGTIDSITYTGPDHTPPPNFSVDPDNPLVSLLSSTQGASVVINTVAGETIAGSLLGLQTFQQQVQNLVTDVHSIVLLRDNQTLLTVPLASLASLNYTHPSLQDLLSRTLSSARHKLHDQDHKQINITCNGSELRNILTSYAIPSPVYKLTYRFLLDDDNVFIQAWAIIDNPCDHDLHNVHVRVISGKPISFIHDLYTARLMQRPEEKVDLRTGLAAPSNATFGLPGVRKRIANRNQLATKAARGSIQKRLQATSLTGTGQGSESGDEEDDIFAPSIYKQAELRAAAPVFPSEAGVAEVGRAAESTEVGELFEYRIKEKVSIKANESALLPLIEERVEGGRVNIYSPDTYKNNTLSAVRIHNSTQATFEGGPVSVFEGTTLVGEGMMRGCRPNCVEFMAYCVNLDCLAERERREEQGKVLSTMVHKGLVKTTRYSDCVTTYRFRNNASEEVNLYVLHQDERGYEFEKGVVRREGDEGASGVVESVTAVDVVGGVSRFCMRLGGGSDTRFAVTERKRHYRAVHLLSLCDRNSLPQLLAENIVTERMVKVMEQIVRIQERKAEQEGEVTRLREKIGKLESNQKRFRTNLQSLGGLSQSAKYKDNPLIKQYIDDLGESEVEIQRLQAEAEKVEDKVEEMQAKIEQVVMSLDEEQMDK